MAQDLTRHTNLNGKSALERSESRTDPHTQRPEIRPKLVNIPQQIFNLCLLIFVLKTLSANPHPQVFVHNLIQDEICLQNFANIHIYFREPESESTVP